MNAYQNSPEGDARLIAAAGRVDVANIDLIVLLARGNVAEATRLKQFWPINNETLMREQLETIVTLAGHAATQRKESAYVHPQHPTVQ